MGSSKVIKTGVPQSSNVYVYQFSPIAKKKESHSGSFRIEHILPILSIYTVLLSLTRPCICYDQIAVACPKARDSVGFAVDVSGGGVVCGSRDSRILHRDIGTACHFP